jgi:hypothetical protein
VNLHFDTAALAAEVAAVKAATAFRPMYDGSTEPGFWLVGDSGVYLMGNQEREPLAKGESYPVIYAREAPKDDYDAKVRAFGHDDGVEFLALADVETWVKNAQEHRAPRCRLVVSPTEIAFSFLQPAQVH